MKNFLHNRSFSRSYVALIGMLLVCIAVLAYGNTLREPFVSAEARFVEKSPGGLQIVPASCASSPHYSGDCSSGVNNAGEVIPDEDIDATGGTGGGYCPAGLTILESQTFTFASNAYTVPEYEVLTVAARGGGGGGGGGFDCSGGWVAYPEPTSGSSGGTSSFLSVVAEGGGGGQRGGGSGGYWCGGYYTGAQGTLGMASGGDTNQIGSGAYGGIGGRRDTQGGSGGAGGLVLKAFNAGDSGAPIPGSLLTVAVGRGGYPGYQHRAFPPQHPAPSSGYNGSVVVTQCMTGEGQCSFAYFCTGNDLYRRNAMCTETFVQACAFGCVAGGCLGSAQSVGDITATPTLLRSGDVSTITWSTANMVAGSCSVTENNPTINDSWTGASGTQTSSPIREQTTYTLSCTKNNNTPFTDSVRVNVIPVFEEQ